jgi:hypothetical protein
VDCLGESHSVGATGAVGWAKPCMTLWPPVAGLTFSYVVSMPRRTAISLALTGPLPAEHRSMGKPEFAGSPASTPSPAARPARAALSTRR